jgi:hypothetical protein
MLNRGSNSFTWWTGSAVPAVDLLGKTGNDFDHRMESESITDVAGDPDRRSAGVWMAPQAITVSRHNVKHTRGPTAAAIEGTDFPAPCAP